MFERGVTMEDARRVLASGETIEEYADDVPYPSRLMLGYLRKRPIHVVAADDVQGDQTIVITVYEPDPQRWDSSFKRRKR